jgi:hypothetical protein
MYLLFAGANYYPAGGWDDFRGQFATVKAAVAAVDARWDWWHVVDVAGCVIVKYGHGGR